MAALGLPHLLLQPPPPWRLKGRYSQPPNLPTSSPLTSSSSPPSLPSDGTLLPTSSPSGRRGRLCSLRATQRLTALRPLCRPRTSARRRRKAEWVATARSARVGRTAARFSLPERDGTASVAHRLGEAVAA